MGDIEQVLQAVKKITLEIIFKYISERDCAIFLFGSLSKGENYRDSDIDIGIICSKKLDTCKLTLIKNEIMGKAKTLRKIDLVDFSSVQDKQFIRIALRKIKIWHQPKNSELLLTNLKKQMRD